MRLLINRWFQLALVAVAVAVAIVGAIGLPGSRETASAGVVATPTATATSTPPAGWRYAIDCDPATSGVQSSCTVHAGQIRVDVVVSNLSTQSVKLAGIEWNVLTDKTVLNPPPVPGCDPGTAVDCNPDFDEQANTGPWDCNGPLPTGDRDRNGDPPSLARSFIACANLAGQALAPGASRATASVIYNASVGTAALSLEDTSLYNENFAELGSCPRVINNRMECNGATIEVIAAVATATACPDLDCDGVPDADDNCPTAANAIQRNTDADYIVIGSGATAIIDVTNAMSDTLGDGCDPDNDNDGLTDTVEQRDFECVGRSQFADGLKQDTDGDRFVDGIECSLGGSPMYPYAMEPFIMPTVAMCGAAGDADGDKLLDRIERCFYNTDPNNADSDGDGTRDGCEAASMNEDRVVTMADVAIIVARFPGKPAGYHANADVTKDGVINVADVGLASSLIPVGQCP